MPANQPSLNSGPGSTDPRSDDKCTSAHTTGPANAPAPDDLSSTGLTQSSLSDAALSMDFYRRFQPAMTDCTRFVLNDDAFAPSPPTLPVKLSKILADPENRSSAWRFIATCGIDGASSVEGRQALCVGLLGYAEQDREECVIPLIEMALYASEHRDMNLYKAVGEVVRSAGLGSEISASTVSGFCDLSSYHALLDKHFHPWIEIFAASNDLSTYERIAETIAERVMAKKPSTYDHLLRTLCRADSSLAATVLHSMVAVPEPPASERIPKPPSLLIGLVYGTRFGLLGFASQVAFSGIAAFLSSDSVGMAIKEEISSPVVWGLSAFIGALGGVGIAKAALDARGQFIAMNDSLREHLKSSDYLHFAERVYARLGESAPDNRYATVLRANMEACGLYGSVMPKWSSSYPIHPSRHGEDAAGKELS